MVVISLLSKRCTVNSKVICWRKQKKEAWWEAVFGMLTCIHFSERPSGFFSPHLKVSSLVSLRNGVAGTELFVGALPRPPPCCLAMGNSFDILHVQFSSLGEVYNKVIIVGAYYHLKRKGRVWVLIFPPVILITSTYIIESVFVISFSVLEYTLIHLLSHTWRTVEPTECNSIS